MYPLEVVIGATWFGIRRTLFSMGSDVTVESSVKFEIDGGWIRLAETYLEYKSSDTLFAAGLLVRSWSIILRNFLLTLSTIFTDAVTSFQYM